MEEDVSRHGLEQLSKKQLIRLVLDLQRRVEKLEQELARLRKDSSTSSKPPSSDLVKPPPAGGPRRAQGARRGGAQPGHEKHARVPFEAEQVDRVVEYVMDRCPDCGGGVRGSAGRARVVQQVELAARPVQITEHRALGFWCPRCRIHGAASLPGEVERGGLLGARLRALVAYLKGGCHASYATVQAFLGEVLGFSVSTGCLAKVVNQTGAALAAPYGDLGRALRAEPWLNVDETGHKDRGQRHWTWCFRAPGYTWFRIDRSRGAEVLREVLGESFGGVVGADYSSAYHRFMGECDVRVQFCFAHLIRDVRYLTTLPDQATREYGERLLQEIRGLFQVLHRKAGVNPLRRQQALENARKKILLKARRAPARSEAQNIAQRFRKNAAAYFEFLATPGVEPTNNRAEQAVRFVVIDRKVTQGTRGERGRAWSERIWSVMATCAQQGRSAYEYLREAVQASLRAAPPPSLLPA